MITPWNNLISSIFVFFTIKNLSFLQNDVILLLNDLFFIFCQVFKIQINQRFNFFTSSIYLITFHQLRLDFIWFFKILFPVWIFTFSWLLIFFQKLRIILTVIFSLLYCMFFSLSTIILSLAENTAPTGKVIFNI